MNALDHERAGCARSNDDDAGANSSRQIFISAYH